MQTMSLWMDIRVARNHLPTTKRENRKQQFPNVLCPISGLEKQYENSISNERPPPPSIPSHSTSLT